jgi:hypothetical protein
MTISFGRDARLFGEVVEPIGTRLRSPRCAVLSSEVLGIRVLFYDAWSYDLSMIYVNERCKKCGARNNLGEKMEKKVKSGVDDTEG